jgi:ribose transport system substrate-binding protein
LPFTNEKEKTMKTPPRFPTVLASVAVLAASTACGGTDGTEATSGTLDCQREFTVEEMLAYEVPTAKEPYNIALMEVSLSGYYYQAMAYGAEQAAKEAGVELEILGGNGYSDASQQLTDAENVIKLGADGILLAPVDHKGSAVVVERAKQHDIAVVNVSTEVDSDGIQKILQDDYVQGQTSAKALVAAAPRGGRGIIMGGPANATWSRNRVTGFTDELAKHQNFSILASTNQDVDPAAGLADFENAAQGATNVDWIYSVHIFTLPPDSLPARFDGIPYVTAGYDPMVIDALEKGQIKASVSNDPVAMGRIGLGQLVAELNADESTVEGITCLPNAILTKDDIGTPVTEAELYPKGYEAK